MGDRYVLQPFTRRGARLAPAEPLLCRDEAEVFRRGRAMMDRMAGLVFYRIDTGASGDQWTEVDLLATAGEVPPEVEAA